MNKINIGIIGLGTIGSAVIEELSRQKEDFKQETGIELVLSAICDINEKRNAYNIPFTKNAEEIIKNGDIDIIIELIGGLHPAYDLIKKAIENKKHVVTANKAIIDKYGYELEQMALENKCYLRFTASVGGGIGIIDKIISSEGNDTRTIMGILNGTTNYILTRMNESLSYEEALKEAQRKGFAESNPEFDVSGKDAAQKLAILTNTNFKARISSQDISCTGIQDINAEDIEFSKKLGYVIKLLAISRVENNLLEARVQPVLVPKNHPLASINYETNAIYLKGKANIVLSGEGAGKPTAATVMSDIKNISRITLNHYQNIRYFGVRRFSMKKEEDTEAEFYLKFHGLDKPGTLHSLTKTLMENNINISQAIQLKKDRGKFVPIIVTVDKTNYGAVKSALSNIDKDKLKVGAVLMILSSDA
jgi:homoserine dehydrogenase